MAARTRTAPLRLTAGEARVLLAGLAKLRAEAPAPETLDPLAERLALLLPSADRDAAMARYRNPRTPNQQRHRPGPSK